MPFAQGNISFNSALYEDIQQRLPKSEGSLCSRGVPKLLGSRSSTLVLGDDLPGSSFAIKRQCSCAHRNAVGRCNGLAKLMAEFNHFPPKQKHYFFHLFRKENPKVIKPFFKNLLLG